MADHDYKRAAQRWAEPAVVDGAQRRADDFLRRHVDPEAGAVQSLIPETAISELPLPGRAGDDFR